MTKEVLIAGGGISGLTLALSCHQVGIPCRVFEVAAQMRPLGAGINLQPSAVRELYALGLEEALAQIGVQTRDFGLYTQQGQHIWTEPRGKGLGYHWPQYSVHRGELLMLLYDEVRRRCGAETVQCGWRARGFDATEGGATLYLDHRDGRNRTDQGAILIGADGIRSAIRAQMVPEEGPPIWGGPVLWRGTTQAKPFLSGASMVMFGPRSKRVVVYPISAADPETGLATINWICERSFDPASGYGGGDYSREAALEDFLPHFEDMAFDWLDIPALVRGAGRVFEYPMVDRDPLPRWTQGRVTLMGDAAHATYPVGSNGAGAGIIDAPKLVAAFLAHGLTAVALEHYEAEMRPETTKFVLMNRKAGPDRIIEDVEARCRGRFDKIEDVMPKAEMDAFAKAYKQAAGYGVAQTNGRGDIIPDGAQFN
ncbi:MAG: flavin-dependent oxidoreductase [Pseudomonadota bacterium]